MSIHFISGKPGGGKTLYSVRMIVGELTRGTRVIVTNVPLKLGELNAYLQEQFPDKLINLHERIIMLDDDTTKEFWRTRPGWTPYPRLTKEDWQTGKLPDYSGVKDDGVLFVIDEVHNFFNSRHWTETGRDAIFYLSQHRHFGDDVVCITQAVRNVDRMFRSIAQDFTWIRNLSKERLGAFRLPSLFLRKVYGSEPNDLSHAMEIRTFTLDASGMAKCYDTAAGVGIHARLADTGEKGAGLPAWCGALLLVVVVAGAFLVIPALGASLFKTPASLVVRPKPATNAAAPMKLLSATPPPAPVVLPARQGPYISTNVWLTGRAMGTVYLSDGSTHSASEVSAEGGSFVVIDGVRYVWRR